MHYLAPENEKPYWQFVGECGLDAKGNHLTDTEEYVFWLELGVLFLRQIFALPPDCEIKVLWAQAPHSEGKFPIIAIGYEQTEDKQVRKYADTLGKALKIFDRSVDWRAIACDQVLRTLAEDEVG